MAQRRYSYGRRYSSSASGSSPSPGSGFDPIGIPRIPYPNEEEHTPTETTRSDSRSPFFIEIFKNRIFLEEIILLGVIFVLLVENTEDDFLIIILIYILLSGRN